jgi:hypothetical protein
MNIHFIQHEVFEALGAYLDWTKKKELQHQFFESI